MNTLQDLRATLDAHAADVHNNATTARVAAVEGRARVVRRRRAAGVGAVAVLAVVAASGVSLLVGDRSPVPADRQLIGKVAPATMESLGYTYHFAKGVEGGEKHATIRLRASDEPRLVTWASDAAEVGILGTADAFHVRSRATDFDDFVLVEAGAPSELSVRAGGADSAIAVYELGDERPAGLTVDGMTFREQVGSDRLVDGVVGEPGDLDVSMQITLPEGRFRLAEYCTGVATEDRLWVNVGVADQGPSASGDCSDDGFDPGAEGQSTWYEPGQLGQPGDTVTLRTWVSKRVDGPVVDSMPGVRLGLALYLVAEPAAVVAGWDMPQLYEHEGHTWSFASVDEAPAGARRAIVTNTESAVRLVVASFSGAGRLTTVAFREPRSGGSDHVTAMGNGSDMVGFLEQGEGASLTVRGDPAPTTRMGFALYERVD